MLSRFQFRRAIAVAQPKKDRFSAHPIVLAKSIISLLTSEARILEDAGFSSNGAILRLAQI